MANLQSFFQTFAMIIMLVNSSTSSRYFELDTSWPNESIQRLPLHGTAVVLDADNNLIYLTRGSNFNYNPGPNPIPDAVLVVIDRETGNVTRQWGENMFFHPHGLEIAINGDIFVTDSHLHQVFKFAYDSSTQLWNNTPIMTLGERLVPGNDTRHFCIPADVAIEPDTENFYIADGYCNYRVVKFDRCGNYLFEFSAGSSGNSIPIPFNIVHKLTVAYRHTTNTNRALRRNVNSDDIAVVVADRENVRIQYFYRNGTFMYEQTREDLGLNSTMLLSVVHVNVNPAVSPYYTNAPSEFGIIYASDNGQGGNNPVPPTILEISVGHTNATVLNTFPTNMTYPYVRTGSAHDITASADGRQVYVCISNSQSLIVKRFNMVIESGALNSFQFISSILLLVASLMATGYGLLL